MRSEITSASIANVQAALESADGQDITVRLRSAVQSYLGPMLADTRKGRRPSFLDAAPPEEAEALVNLCAKYLMEMGVHVETGRFGAQMEVSLLNDGPVTILLDSRMREA